MVRFQVRWTKKLHKSKEHHYKHYNMDFPAELNAEIETVGQVFTMRYDGPFIPWFMRRNEVAIEVDL